jgi:hypothetical protein
LQREIVTPRLAQVPNAVIAGTLKWRKGADRPNAYQAAFGVALDLQGQQQNLQQHDAGEQNDGFMTRRYNGHVV